VGLDFWKNLTLKNYHFILFEYDVTRERSSIALARDPRGDVLRNRRNRDRLDRSAHAFHRPEIRRLRLVDSTRLAGHRYAAALIQFWLRLPLHLYGTLAILFLAYAARYLPLGVRSANAAMRQIDPSLEESARILGASWSRTAREITLP